MGIICSWYVAGSVVLCTVAYILHSFFNIQSEDLNKAVEESLVSTPIQCTGNVFFILAGFEGLN